MRTIEIEVQQFKVFNLSMHRENPKNRFTRSTYTPYLNSAQPTILVHQSAKYGETEDSGNQYSKGIWFTRIPSDDTHYSELPEIPFLPDLSEEEYFQLFLVAEYNLPLDMILAIQKKHVLLMPSWSVDSVHKFYLEY